MSRGVMATAAALALLTVGPEVAMAGMPSFTLADLGRTLALSELTHNRLQATSFFVACLLVCAWVIQLLWNGLRNDFPRLPRLSYGKACGVIVLWGLLFVLVLTMISGARELLTPGAWEKSGWTYRLADDPAEVVTRQIAARHEAMERIRDSLMHYANAHSGAFPECSPPCTMPELLRDIAGQSYVYVNGRTRVSEWERGSPLLYEADTFGPDRLVILTDGSLVWLPATAIEQAERTRTR